MIVVEEVVKWDQQANGSLGPKTNRYEIITDSNRSDMSKKKLERRRLVKLKLSSKFQTKETFQPQHFVYLYGNHKPTHGLLH